MKKIYCIAAMSALAILSIACSKEETTPPYASQTRQIKVTVTAELPSNDAATNNLPSNDAATKATWADGEGFNWDATADAADFGLIGNDGTAVKSTAVTLTDGSATITAETSSEDGTLLHVFYPASQWYNAAGSTTQADSWFNFATSGNGVQTQAVAGTLDNVDGKVVMVSRTPLTLSTDELKVSLKMVSSLVRFIVYSESGSTESVKSVSITAASSTRNLWGQMQAISKFDGSGTSWINSAVGSTTASVELTTPFSLDGITSAAQSSGIYLGVIPTTLTGYTYTVTTDKAAYTFTSEKTKEFKEGYIHNIKLNLDKGTREDTSTQVTWTHGGKTQNVSKTSGILYIGATAINVGGTEITDKTAKKDNSSFKIYDADNNDITSSDDLWVHPAWVNNDDFNFSITYDKNMTTAKRTAYIYLVYDGVQSSTAVTVNQDPGPAYYAFSVPTALSAKASDTEATLAITADSEVAWTIAEVEGLTFSQTSGSGSASVTVSFAANTDSDAKTYSIVVSTEETNVETASYTCTLTQKGVSAATNLWTSSTQSIRYVYFSTSGWSLIEEVDQENVTSENVTLDNTNGGCTITLPTGCGGGSEWNAQVFLKNELAMSSSNTYDISFKITIASNTNVYYKLVTYSESGTHGEGAVIGGLDGWATVAADGDVYSATISKEAATGADASSVMLIVAPGWASEGTVVTVSDISIVEN